MALDQEYPKTHRNFTSRLRTLLECDSNLCALGREQLAEVINTIANKARDLEDILQRLLNEPHAPAGIGELLIAFERTAERLRDEAEIIDRRLYALGNRLKRLPQADSA